jgi:hypothetical protein
MSRFAAPFTALTLALALGTTGCGEAKVQTPDAGNTTDGLNPYLPLAVGNWWTYKVTDNDGVTIEKTTTVVEEQKVGGSGPNADLDAVFVRTTKTNSETEDKTESWQGTVEFEEGQFATVRYREIAYHAANGMKELEEHWDPYKLRADNFHVSEDGPWTENYTETKLFEDPKTPDILDQDHYDVWSVQANETSITVPASTEPITNARQFIRKATDPSDPDKLYWFVPDIGKVQETGSQVEQLVDCYIGGKTCAEILAAQ